VLSNADRIELAIKKTLFFIKTSIDDRCPVVRYVDIQNGKNRVSVECYEDDTYGVIIDREPNQMASYFFDTHSEATDVAIKLLCDW